MTTPPDPLGGTAALPRAQVLGGNALGVASMVLWSAGFPAAEILLATWPPLTLIAARFVLALGLLIGLWLLLEGPGPLRRARWGAGLRVGSLCFGVGAWLLLIAQDLTDPVTVAIIASTCPLAATIIENVAVVDTVTGDRTPGMSIVIVLGPLNPLWPSIARRFRTRCLRVFYSER